jgi:hypothetical protein
MSSVAISNYAIGSTIQSGNGFALESKSIEQKYRDFLEHFKETESIGRHSEIQTILSELDEILRSCSQDNWDGYGANAISVDTYLEARKIIHMLNSAFLNFPMPEITPEPDGNIGFEWNDNYGRTLLFSIDDNQTLTYAGIFGLNKAHGYETLNDFIPGTLIYYLKRLYPR